VFAAGHGVGAALNVHEGPQSISTRYWITTPLQVRIKQQDKSAAAGAANKTCDYTLLRLRSHAYVTQAAGCSISWLACCIAAAVLQDVTQAACSETNTLRFAIICRC
jgi:hypothetical protein